MPAERFDFANAQGHTLAALLDLPPGEPRAYALFAHCFTCGKDVHAAKRIAEGLTALGIAVLRFDFTGLGASEGEFANTTFSSNVADLVAAADELRRKRRAPAILIGHSLGGTAVLAAASQVAEARAVVTIAATPPRAPACSRSRRTRSAQRARSRSRSAAGNFAQSVRPATTAPSTCCSSTTAACARHCCFSPRRPTRSSASTMRAASSPPPS